MLIRQNRLSVSILVPCPIPSIHHLLLIAPIWVIFSLGVLIMQYFLYGLGVGLIIAIAILIGYTSRLSRVRKEARAESEKYKKMLTDRMELENEGIAKLKAENEELKRLNENLRVSLVTVSQKPGRKEMQKLQIYQKAVDRLTLNSPGFAPVWQAAIKESEDEFAKTFSGFMPFIKKVIPARSDAQLLEGDDEQRE